MFRDVEATVDFVALEESIISFWRERDVFRKSVDKPAPRGRFVFYEGPPTANGKPGVHHVSSRAYKDIFPRFRTMRSEEHTSELQSRGQLVCRLLLEKKKTHASCKHLIDNSPIVRQMRIHGHTSILIVKTIAYNAKHW